MLPLIVRCYPMADYLQVFCCVNGACGYFYHPRCVATLLHPGDDAASEELEKRIADGEPFACPIHKCHVCKELESRSTKEMQFAVCRRCPKAYHRKCLPRCAVSVFWKSFWSRSPPLTQVNVFNIITGILDLKRILMVKLSKELGRV